MKTLRLLLGAGLCWCVAMQVNAGPPSPTDPLNGNTAVAQAPGPQPFAAPTVASTAISNASAPAAANNTILSGLIGGASVYILKPYFSSNPAFSTNLGIGTPTATQTTQDFSWSYNAAPALWLGWISESGLGFRARDFYFDQNSQNASASLTAAQAATASIVPPGGLASPPGTATFGAPGVLSSKGFGTDVLNFNSNLKINALDVEGLYDIRGGSWAFLLSGGGRYLQLAQNYHATLANSVSAAGATATENDTLNTGHNFYGGGPTAALQTIFQVGQTGLCLYGLARGSLLVGTSHQTTGFNQNVVDPAGIAGGSQKSSPFASSSRDLVLPVFELELGVEYGVTVLGNRAFVRGAVVNQTYFGAGSASQTSGDLGLFGAQISTGLYY